ncbi:TraR/DksA C4-type zinc finger protein [Clostridium guangxiense]|uniref:TraR/DksA C4-type zinc finger protein n=1 Tax=Clostridium guangxiense TaxID=1662055 RepID=UPI001E2979DC|nr:TraR/DksA C4-type zinc finger protein [Clostridium guangxiense]MCD2345188.1 TraR/DksA C4-type zinc finger protein [Clostridium guangxiense]
MEKNKLDYYEKKLINEKKKVNDLLENMRKNETIDSKSEIASELSFYDNHPSDLATEISDIERGMAFRENETTILEKIDAAINRIQDGSYGICKNCGKKISEERLEFLPYAENCVECQTKISSIKPRPGENRPVEEEVLGYPFSTGFRRYSSKTGFDLEDSYDAVQNFDKRPNTMDDFIDDDEYVDFMDKVSNAQYKDQLPD